MMETSHDAPQQKQSPIEDLDEIGQDAAFDAMLDTYRDPPADVRNRLAGIAARTRAVLDGGEMQERSTSADHAAGAPMRR